MIEEDPTARAAQASGMVSVQADCSCAEALEMLKQRAADSGQTLEQVAEAVVNRDIRIESRQTA